MGLKRKHGTVAYEGTVVDVHTEVRGFLSEASWNHWFDHDDVTQLRPYVAVTVEHGDDHVLSHVDLREGRPRPGEPKPGDHVFVRYAYDGFKLAWHPADADAAE